MADEPTRSGGEDTPSAPLTVAELLARSGAAPVSRRRAERRETAEATGRQQAVGADGRPVGDRPPLRGGVRRDSVGPPTGGSAPVPATGWQPAMPAEQPADQPAMPAGPPTGLSVRRPEDARPAPAAQPPTAQPPAAQPPWPQPPASRPRPAQQAPATPPAAGPPPVPPRPAAAAGPRPAAAPVAPVAPVPPTPAPTPPPVVPPPVVPPAPPRPAAAAPVLTPVVLPAPRVVPPLSVTPAAPSGPPALPGTPPVPPPYASVPVPGVRRSQPLPPIPGRDLPPPVTAAAPPPPRAPASPRRRRLTRAALALVALLGLVAAYYVGLYFYVDRSIDRVDALVVDGPEVLAAQLQEDAQTYLVVGTGLPGRSGPAAVSTLIAHVSGAGEQAVLVSVPPTALSDTPTCRDGDGEVRPAVTEPFAAALLDGGPSCLVRSVQQLTGLRVDHYLAVDLDRLPDMVDALGEVPVCLTRPSATTGARLDLPAGQNALTSSDVTDFLRGTGSDVTGSASAQREQLVLTSTLRTALSGGTLADPLTLTRFLTRAADAFTVDADTTLGDVRALGATLGDLSGSAVDRAEIPVAQVGYFPVGSDRAAVVVDVAATRELFDAVIDGGRLPVAATAEVPDPAAGAAPADAPADALPQPVAAEPVPAGTVVSVEPAGVTVDVLDATGGARTAEVADGLASLGFQVRARGVEPAAVDRTVVRYAPASLEVARTVAAAVPGSLLLETDEVGTAVQLVVGPDYTGLAPVALGTAVPTTAAPAPVEGEAGAASCS
ncbi:LCP family protein [Modestobacter versicolor]|uniref:LCP family protein n=1 Tax=Modestobacter versicolor TaxID=429133 RepID=UPI0034E0567E